MPKIYSGEWLSAICVTDEFAGVDPVSTIATAVYDAAKDEFVLNGIKTWVTNGSDCTLFTVFANVNTEEHAVNPLTAFLVERNSPGIGLSTLRKIDKKHKITECVNSSVSKFGHKLLWKLHSYSQARRKLQEEKTFISNLETELLTLSVVHS